jgi:hypothetical protein
MWHAALLFVDAIAVCTAGTISGVLWKIGIMRPWLIQLRDGGIDE